MNLLEMKSGNVLDAFLIRGIVKFPARVLCSRIRSRRWSYEPETDPFYQDALVKAVVQVLRPASLGAAGLGGGVRQGRQGRARLKPSPGQVEDASRAADLLDAPPGIGGPLFPPLLPSAPDRALRQGRIL
jgi:hypothetical protein